MQWHKVHWKFLLKDQKNVDPHQFFATFNDWIPDSPEIFVDVADYSHVTDGPLTVLVGNKADCMLDNSDGRVGFVFAVKRGVEINGEAGLLQTLAKACAFADRLVNSPRFEGKLALDTNDIELIANDRALVPNTDETFKAAIADLEGALSKIWGSTPALTRVSNERRRFGVIAHFENAPTLAEIAKRAKAL